MRLLILDIDSMKADHLGCYGYERDTSPNIDRIAEEGMRFENYYTSDAPCLPSRTALMTGQFGIHNGVVGHGGVAADLRLEGEARNFQDRLATGSLAGLLRGAGLKTALISPFPERHSSWAFNAGFNEIYNTGDCGMEEAEQVTPVVTDWLERHGEQDDWCLYVNYWDPHTPYRTPEKFGNPFKDVPLPRWMTEDVLEKHRDVVGPHSIHEIDMYWSNPLPQFPRYPTKIETMTDMKRMFDGYDCGIRYADEQIGKILNLLAEQGVLEDTAIIITADHGENIGELGIYGEHGTADQGTCRIPMIIRWPGRHGRTVDHAFHYSLDLLPTLADLLGQEKRSHWDGQSYAETIKHSVENGRDYLIVSQCAHVCQRSVRFENWLYIRTYHDGYHLFDKEMLFDLENDPHEQKNLAQAYPEVCKEAVYYLNEWHDEQMTTMSFDNDPLWTVMKEGGPYHAKGHLPMYVERLRKTGREQLAQKLIDRHPEEFK
ncbi:sulfatase [Listeria costaricensis]|uniref:sulfatase family protein n=1 Tax=Listeria costaricensis TaxID=2026604 RepID=UPI000C06D187|nr:sulfatase [Listeria costaricensis]